MLNLGLNITFVAIVKFSPEIVTYSSVVKETFSKIKIRPIVQFIAIVSGLFLFSIGANSQVRHRMELGGFIGMSSYYGELNASNPIYQPHLAFGGVGRLNISDRLALKATLFKGALSGSSDKVLFYNGSAVDYSFGNKQIGDATMQLEFNFLPYDNQFLTNTTFTPYISFGLGTTLYKRFKSDEQGDKVANTVFVLSLPFSIGIKYKINDWVRIGAEWSIRKLFVDDLDVDGSTFDVYPDDPLNFNKHSNLHDNDWYSYTGIYVTFSMLRRKSTCNSGF